MLFASLRMVFFGVACSCNLSVLSWWATFIFNNMTGLAITYHWSILVSCTVVPSRSRTPTWDTGSM